jgi:2-methylcitrate dehydratase PrpD
MVLDAEVDRAYPARWIGKVAVTTRDGHEYHARVDEPKGDPGNTLSRDELEDKAIRLAAYGGAADKREMRAIAQRVWTIADAPAIGQFLR